MIPVLSVIMILIFSIMITKFATAMLANTGLSRQTASFQARSAFTGCGFTTVESEKITRHPIRRKIIFNLMLMGNAGIVTVIASVLLTFVNQSEKSLPWYYNVAIILGGVILLWILLSHHRIDEWLTKVIDKMLGRYSKIYNKDFSSLYTFSDDFHIAEMEVQEGSWLAEKVLGDTALRSEGISILGIERTDSSYLGVPSADTVVHTKDIIILYGREEVIKNLDKRKANKAGDAAHDKAVKAYMEEIKKQDNSS